MLGVEWSIAKAFALEPVSCEAGSADADSYRSLIMGKILPATSVAQIAFFENHTADWAANSAAIGTTAGAVTALTTKTTASRAAYNAQQLAQEQARAATAVFHAAVVSMNKAGTDIIKQVKARAATDGNGVYTLALLPIPATPGPVAAPGTPTNFTVVLNPDGSLKLRWKCPNPAGAGGTIYQISRRTGSTGALNTIGGSGTRSFIDATVPAGVASVMYQIVAVRSTASGTAAQFLVHFGTGASGGEAIASVVAVTAPKLAA